ncbi:hypothetical protein F5Y16DRAFT_401666 [Xylariaceae sp. FL0255]|nr:hypothetical protein F5Y16DRAFT_401666 [Xylariaceae sp. FL0255]
MSPLRSSGLELGQNISLVIYGTAWKDEKTSELLTVALRNVFRVIESKFSPIFTHNPTKIPDDTEQPIAAQVKESVEQTFRNLQLEYLDVMLLHCPYPDDEGTLEAWEVLESLYDVAARVKPVIVQNHFYLDSLFDSNVRIFRKDHSIVYQAF